jgi:hypothetical protein
MNAHTDEETLKPKSVRLYITDLLHPHPHMYTINPNEGSESKLTFP